MENEFTFVVDNPDDIDGVSTWGLCSNVDWNPENKEGHGYTFARGLVEAFTEEAAGGEWNIDDWESDEWDMCRRVAGEHVYSLESQGTWRLVATWSDLWNGGPTLCDNSEMVRGPANAEVDIPAMMSRDLEESAADFLHYLGEAMAEAHQEWVDANEDDEEEE